MKKYLTRYLPLGLLLALFAILTLTNAFYTADMLLCDNVYKKLESPRRDVKIIAIDERTEAAYGKFELWSREKLADLTQMLSADPELAPAVLVYDIMFIGDGDPETDARLAEACANAKNVVCATNLVYGGRMEQQADGTVAYAPDVVVSEELPFAPLNQTVTTGFSNACISDDNIIRYAQIFADKDGQRRYSMAYEAYRLYAQQIGQRVTEPKTSGGQTGFFYSGEPGDIPHVSLVDVLEGKVPLSEFDDCLVYVGVYAAGFQDAYSTPVMRGQLMHGVEINANVTLALLAGKLANPAPLWLYVLAAAGVILLWMKLRNHQKLALVILDALVLMAAHLLLGRLLAHWGWLIPQVYFPVTVALVVLSTLLQSFIEERIHHRHTVQMLKKYVAPQIVDKLSKDGRFELHLGGEKRHIAVLFVDIRGFTTLSESLPPEEVVAILNHYLSVTTQAVFANEGTLDKFVGDATMAVFNAPFDLEDYVFKAVKTAWDIKQGVESLAKDRDLPVRVGVGVNCGEAVVGNIGCEVRMDYTAIGDTVNTAARLESNAKAGHILISQAVYDVVGHRITAEAMGQMALKGKAAQVAVYSVTDFPEQAAIPPAPKASPKRKRIAQEVPYV